MNPYGRMIPAVISLMAAMAHMAYAQEAVVQPVAEPPPPAAPVPAAVEEASPPAPPSMPVGADGSAPAAPELPAGVPPSVPAAPGAPAVSPEAPNIPAAPGTPAVPDTAGAAAAAEKPAAPPEPAVYKTMIFTARDMQKMPAVIDNYLRRKQAGKLDEKEAAEDDGLDISGLAIPTTQPKWYVYPQFFLSSLVYYHSGRWSVWVNGERIAQDTQDGMGTLTVQTINAQQATFLWRPSPQDRIDWDKRTGATVSPDRAKSEIVFTLKPNQTFSSYLMNTVEGRVQPAIVDANSSVKPPPSLPASSQPALPGTVSGKVPPGGAEEERTGLGGLINRYRDGLTPAAKE